MITDSVHTQTADRPCNPVSSFSQQELEQRFCAVVDAKNAVTLRQSATLADIGDCLLLLDSKLRLYETDDVFVNSAVREMHMIEQQSSTSFLGLEVFRSTTSRGRHGQSFYEKNRLLCSSVQRAIDAKEENIQVAYQFLSDPSCLVEHRLVFFAAATSQR